MKGVAVALMLMLDKCCIVGFSLMRATKNVDDAVVDPAFERIMLRPVTVSWTQV